MKPQSKKPNINNIKEADLKDGSRVLDLLKDAVKKKVWGSSESHRTDFFSFAAHALRVDDQKNPGKLFRWLLKNEKIDFITNQDEREGLKLLREAQYRDERVVVSSLDRASNDLENILSSEEITYMHSTMVQCFFPQKKLPKDKIDYQIDHGRVSLNITAGNLMMGEQGLVRQQVPSGSKSRIIMAYINQESIRTKNKKIDMGHSLTDFMRKSGLSIAGRNAREVEQQVKNIAAADITIGGFNGKHSLTVKAPIVDAVDFWLEKNPRQDSLWTPELCLSDKYYDALMERPVPLFMPHVIELQKSPRDMDLYAWLSYRLPRVRRPVKIPYASLQVIFGDNVSSLRKFKQKLNESLKRVLAVYKDAKVEAKESYLELRYSKEIIPMKEARRLMFDQKN